jgi:hypothetical protein
MTRLWLAGLLWASSACTAHVFSPPAGGPPIESSATVGKGRTGFEGDYFLAKAVFGPTLSSARVTARHGFTDKHELSLAPSYSRIHGARQGDSNPDIFALRLQLKYAPVRHFALAGGLGGGGSAGGGFVTPDVGVIGGWENRYLVPFASARVFLSAPFAARTVRLVTDDDQADHAHDEDSAPDHYMLRPKLTWGGNFALGLRVPLSWDDAASVKPSLLCAWALTRLRDKKTHTEYSGLDCALQVVF